MSGDETGWFGRRDEKAAVNPNNRTCSSCGGECVPEVVDAGGLGLRFAFKCDVHGVQSVFDPFADSR